MQTTVTAIDIMLEPDATMLKHADRAGSEQLRLEVAALLPTAEAEAAKKKATVASKRKNEKPEQ